MKMYKDGHEANVDKDQFEAMKKSGWTREKPEAEEVQEAPEVEAEEVVEEVVEEAAPAPKKKPAARRTGRIKKE